MSPTMHVAQMDFFISYYSCANMNKTLNHEWTKKQIYVGDAKYVVQIFPFIANDLNSTLFPCIFEKLHIACEWMPTVSMRCIQ